MRVVGELVDALKGLGKLLAVISGLCLVAGTGALTLRGKQGAAPLQLAAGGWGRRGSTENGPIYGLVAIGRA